MAGGMEFYLIGRCIFRTLSLKFGFKISLSNFRHFSCRLKVLLWTLEKGNSIRHRSKSPLSAGQVM